MKLKDIAIRNMLASLRIGGFIEKKEIIDDRLSSNQPLYDNKYDPSKFLALLSLLDKPEYGGLRIYFAIRNTKKNLLTLIYAPTFLKDDKEAYNDVGLYYILNDKGDFKERHGNAKTWATNFTKEILPCLPKNETQVMFYDISFVRDLKDILQKNSLRDVRVFFAAYLKKIDEYPYPSERIDDDIYTEKLTLIFNLRGPKIVKKLTGDDGGNSIFLAPLSNNSTNVDTGNPCPPPNSPPCPGAKLLQ